jgi:hypothetical protein
MRELSSVSSAVARRARVLEKGQGTRVQSRWAYLLRECAAHGFVSTPRPSDTRHAHGGCGRPPRLRAVIPPIVFCDTLAALGCAREGPCPLATAAKDRPAPPPCCCACPWPYRPGGGPEGCPPPPMDDSNLHMRNAFGCPLPNFAHIRNHVCLRCNGLTGVLRCNSFKMPRQPQLEVYRSHDKVLCKWNDGTPRT